MTGKLQQRLQEDLKTALRAGEKERLLVIRSLIAELKNEQIRVARDDLSDDEETQVLRRAAKMRRDAVETARQANRSENAANEQRELDWIEAYLPRQLSEAEIEAKARELLAELGITSRKEQGRFMKEWMARYKAVSDGKVVNDVLGRLLA